MKGKIALLAALALVGLMVMPAVAAPYVHQFPYPFVIDGNIFTTPITTNITESRVAFVIGERALTHDVVGATLVGIKVGANLYYTMAPDMVGTPVVAHDWIIEHHRFDLLGPLQGDPLDGTTTWVMATNFSATVGRIFCVHPDVEFWINPFDLDDSTLEYAEGQLITASEMKDVEKAGVILLDVAGTYVPLLGAGIARNSDQSYTFGAGDYDAKTGTNFPGGSSIDWRHVGFQFTWPPYPQWLELDRDYPIPWLGHTMFIENIDTGAGIVEFGIKDASGAVIDMFSVPIGARAWYTFMGANMLKIEVDVDRDGTTEAVLPYFYIDLYEVDTDEDYARCQFFSAYFVPPKVVEGWVASFTAPLIYSPVLVPAWGDSFWAFPPEVVVQDEIDEILAYQYAAGIDLPFVAGSDYALAEGGTGDDVAVIMTAVSPSGKIFLGEFDTTIPGYGYDGDMVEKVCGYFIWPELWKGGDFFALSFYDDGEEFAWTVPNLSWILHTTRTLVEDDGTEHVVWWTFVGPDGQGDEESSNLVSFYEEEIQVIEKEYFSDVESGDTFEGYVDTVGVELYDQDLEASVYYTATSDDEDMWAVTWYETLLTLYNVTGVYAEIYERFNCLPGTMYTGTLILAADGTASYPAGEGDQVFAGEDVFCFTRAPLAYLDSQVWDPVAKTLKAGFKDMDMILFGGPHVNMVVDHLNDTALLPLNYVVDKLYDPRRLEYINLSYALQLAGWPGIEALVPKFTTGLGVIQYSTEDPWGKDNWILVIGGTDRYGTYAACVALADHTKIIRSTAANFCNTTYVIVIGVTPGIPIRPPIPVTPSPVVLVTVGAAGVTPIGGG